MYNVSKEYIDAINANVRTVGIYVYITLTDGEKITLRDKDILQRSLYINSRCVSENDIELGSTYSSELGFSMKYNGNILKLRKATVTPYFAIYCNGIEYPVPLGTFSVDDISINGNYVKLICLDYMTKFDKKLSLADMDYDVTETSCGLLKTVNNFVQFCCKKCNAKANYDPDSFANTNSLLAIRMEKDNLLTYRDVLESALQLMGAFAVMGRTGNLEIRKFGNTPVAISTPQNRFKLTSSNLAIDALAVFYKNVVTSSSDSVYAIDLSDNKLLEYFDVTQYGKIREHLTEINNKSLNGISYSPCTIEYMGDPALDVGDMIQVNPIIPSLSQYTYGELEGMTYGELEKLCYGQLSDYYFGTPYNAIIMQHNWVYRGKSTIYCYGKSAELRKVYV